MKPLKRIYSLIVLCLLFSFWSAGCALQTPAPPKWTTIDPSALEGQLTLEKCLELAKNNQIQVVQWKSRLDAAHAELRQSKILPNPTLGISWEDIGLEDELGKSVSTVAYGISYPIFFWWTYPEKIKAAKLNQLSEQTAVLSEQRQLETEIASAYFNIVAGQKKLSLAEDILDNYSELLRLAKKQNQLNEISGLSLEQARLEMLRAESDLQDAQSQLRADQMSFAFALGADRPFYPVLMDCEEKYIHPEGIPLDNNELTEEDLNEGLQNDYDYISKQIAADYAASKLRIEKLNAIPLVNVSGSAGKKDSPEGDSTTYSVDIPIPLFDRNQAGIESAYAELRTAQAEEEKARRAAIEKITTKWEEYRTLAWKWEQYSKNSNQLAEKNSRTASRLYEMGRISYTEMLQSQHEYKTIQIEAADDWRDLCTASWEISLIFVKR
jgi:cobalt-zinc-cadmium efflux system outer membrane protein